MDIRIFVLYSYFRKIQPKTGISAGFGTEANELLILQ